MTDTPSLESLTVSVEEEIADTSMDRPHVLLLGAGASQAALPDGDRNGVPVPLLRDVAHDIDLFELFPDDLRDLAGSDFESAYSNLIERDDQTDAVAAVNERVDDYFSALELPEGPNLYDVLQLSLREKDAIFTFNWDPFLIQSRARLRATSSMWRLTTLGRCTASARPQPRLARRALAYPSSPPEENPSP